ncbi:MarR family winged helix-turn-helix transcriptional regulator, partial [Enterobacter hormaechei]|uniref:MarR family winged helix-turn-helix transcriptional regulator n=1 Tax=Enterobacter hormaechei TaxID=158836 RepID=UPI0034D63601
PATMFGVAGRLAKRGLVTPSVDPNDARLVLLELTDVGRETVEAMKARGLEVTDKTLAPLSRDEAETLVRLLTKLG